MVSADRIELSPHAPKARILPLYDAEIFGTQDGTRTHTHQALVSKTSMSSYSITCAFLGCTTGNAPATTGSQPARSLFAFIHHMVCTVGIEPTSSAWKAVIISHYTTHTYWWNIWDSNPSEYPHCKCGDHL